MFLLDIIQFVQAAFQLSQFFLVTLFLNKKQEKNIWKKKKNWCWIYNKFFSQTFNQFVKSLTQNVQKRFQILSNQLESRPILRKFVLLICNIKCYTSLSSGFSILPHRTTSSWISRHKVLNVIQENQKMLLPRVDSSCSCYHSRPEEEL